MSKKLAVLSSVFAGPPVLETPPCNIGLHTGTKRPCRPATWLLLMDKSTSSRELFEVAGLTPINAPNDLRTPFPIHACLRQKLSTGMDLIEDRSKMDHILQYLYICFFFVVDPSHYTDPHLFCMYVSKLKAI